jgi:arylsulfatase A-like enzyme
LLRSSSVGPGKVLAGRVCNGIVHIVNMYPTLARVGGAEVPKDRPIDGVDQLDFFLSKQENSNREGFPAYVVTRKISALQVLFSRGFPNPDTRMKDVRR